MRSRFLALVLPALALSGCVGGMDDDDFYLAGPVAPPGKYVPDVYVPDIVTMEDFLAAAGTNTVFFDTDESTLTPQARGCEAIREAVNARLGKTQRLAQLHAIEDMPRRHIGKLLKTELREEAARRGLPA